ncbi:NAD(P)/FAD-dependent oxidoreductase [Hydrogenimonas urashimensis]|uniref:NAD(P)/FAD-dependent oxidoreductase n=1 Tax=Hydrogenimonas urashimensis TaxID=2740515 RepID=UPI00191680AE|nr:NAD(P)/FAD-dependent oxidoreductase [Hydrogenimonas urashimensis]
MHRIVVLGGGYGGLRAIEKLVHTPHTEITLIDRNGYHYMQTEVYGYIAGTKDIDELAIDLEAWCEGFDKPVRFVRAEVKGIDTENCTVRLDGKSIPYDSLIIATGAKTNFPPFIEGLRAHSYGVKRLDRAFGFHHRFQHMVERKLEGDDEIINIVVAGAGLSGVEVAAEMAYMLRRYRKMIGKREREIRITLVDACDTILPGMHPRLIQSALKRLENLGVIVRTSAFIASVDDRRLHFKDGDRIPYTFIIFTGGIQGVSDFVPETFEKNRLEQLKVTPHLRVKGHTDIYAIGDVAEITDSEGNPLPPTAQIAEKSAEYVAKSISNRLRNVETAPFAAKMDGLFIALGGRYGAAELFGVRFSGIGVYYLKRIVTLIYYLGISLRVNAGYKVRK